MNKIFWGSRQRGKTASLQAALDAVLYSIQNHGVANSPAPVGGPAMTNTPPANAIRYTCPQSPTYGGDVRIGDYLALMTRHTTLIDHVQVNAVDYHSMCITVSSAKGFCRVIPFQEFLPGGQYMCVVSTAGLFSGVTASPFTVAPFYQIGTGAAGSVPPVPLTGLAKWQALSIGDKVKVKVRSAAGAYFDAEYLGFSMLADEFRFKIIPSSIYTPYGNGQFTIPSVSVINGIVDFTFLEVPAGASTPSAQPKKCSHPEWKTYVGFTDTFEYCGTCDMKRSESK